MGAEISESATIAAQYRGPFAEELSRLEPIVRHAGAIALRYHGTDLRVSRKEGDEPVTRADRECSEYLVAALADAFPSDVIISEEAEDDSRRLAEERVWYVDPIDGTKSFIRGDTGYCVMVGLAVRHRPVVGMLFQPNLGTLVYAAQGGGAWVLRGDAQAQRLRSSTQTDPTKARLLSRQGGDRVAVERFLGIPRDQGLGSIGIKMAALALGAYEFYVNPATNCSSWDTCGPEILLEEAGGRLTDMSGQRIRYDLPETTSLQNGLIASSGPMHEAIVSRLWTLFPPEPS